MPDVSVTVPGLLARYTDDQRVVRVDGATLGACLDRLFERYPHLRPHLFTDGGAPREHLVFLVDGTAVDPVEEGDTETEAGSSVVIVQAVSGG